MREASVGCVPIQSAIRDCPRQQGRDRDNVARMRHGVGAPHAADTGLHQPFDRITAEQRMHHRHVDRGDAPLAQRRCSLHDRVAGAGHVIDDHYIAPSDVLCGEFDRHVAIAASRLAADAAPAGQCVRRPHAPTARPPRRDRRAAAARRPATAKRSRRRAAALRSRRRPASPASPRRARRSGAGADRP